MTATFHVGDAIQVMNTLPEKSVDLILSSPPFLALRSYLPSDHPDKALEGGSQATPGAYIDWLVDVVEACDRILAPHGSLCIELGDTYAGSGGGGGDYLEGGWREGQAQFAGSAASMKESNAAHWRQKNAVKEAWPLAKSLSLIPELFRLTLVYGQNPLTGRQTERWRLRNVIRWVRPNPPVGALGDKFRPATSELMVFCKSAKRFFDLDAVRVPHSVAPETMRGTLTKGQEGDRRGGGDDRWGGAVHAAPGNPAGAPPLDWWEISVVCPDCGGSGCGRISEHRDEGHTAGLCYDCHCYAGRVARDNSDTPLDWWNIPPGGYSGSHYAVWPEQLCVKPIKAMCPERVCKVCGEPSRRITEPSPEYGRLLGKGYVDHTFDAYRGLNKQGVSTTAERMTLGWGDCGHSNYRFGVVLDPFAGSGTTLAVATGHGRDAIGIDLDERNYDLALERVGPLILQRGEVAA